MKRPISLEMLLHVLIPPGPRWPSPGLPRARAPVGAVSVWPCVSAVLPAGMLLLRAPLLPMLACDAVSRDVFCHPAALACRGTCVCVW